LAISNAVEAGKLAWVISAGNSIRLSTPPRLSASVNVLVGTRDWPLRSLVAVVSEAAGDSSRTARDELPALIIRP
jgi:hypothetical protein